MIEVTKNEKDAICRMNPNARVVRTMKQHSKRHHYFLSEEKGAYQMLMELRSRRRQNQNDERECLPLPQQAIKKCATS